VSKKRKQNGKRRQQERDPWINRWVRKSEMRAHPTQVVDWNTDEVIHEFESVYTTLGRAGDRAGEEWLWCYVDELAFELPGDPSPSHP